MGLDPFGEWGDIGRCGCKSDHPQGPAGQAATWFEAHLRELFECVRAARASDRSGPVRSIVLEAPDSSIDGSKGVFRVYSDEIGAAKCLSATKLGPRISVAVYWPSSPDLLPNQPIPGKVIRIDTSKKQADVRATIGRSDRELCGAPFKAIFDLSALLSNGEDRE